MHAAVIANPKAGLLRRQPELVEDMARTAGSEVELCLPDSLESLDETAERLARAGCQHVGIVGGDGTASTTLTAIERAFDQNLFPTVSLLRGGTMNTVANSLGVPRGTPAQRLREAMAAWRSPGHTGVRARPTLRIGNRLGFLFGTGVFHGYMASYYAAGNGHPTPVTAARVFARAVASALVDGPTYRQIFRPTPVRIEFERGHWDEETYMTVCAGTVEQAGLGFKVFHRAFEADDRFQLIAINGTPANVVSDLPSIWTGQGLRPRTAHQALVPRALLRAQDGKTIGYSVDGDIYEVEGPLPLELGPSFRFLLPKHAPI